MKTKWIKAGLFGILGTALLDIAGLLFTGHWWTTPALLARVLGAPWAAALVLHYGIGITLAIIYAALVPALIGPGGFCALFFTSVESLFLAWFLLFPLLGLSIAGLGAGILLPLLSMARHWAYAISLTYYLQIVERTSENEIDLTQIVEVYTRRISALICCPSPGNDNISFQPK